MMGLWLLAVLGCLLNGSDAFVTNKSTKTAKSSSTELYIIGPMIRKMREENEKKKMPMASPEERMTEAPGLRVGSNAWKWPPVWPYENDMFKRKDQIEAEAKPQANPMAGLLSGGLANLPTSMEQLGAAASTEDEAKEEKEVKLLDTFEYWEKEVADVTTDLDDAAALRLKGHLNFYLKDDMSVLEFGAAENSYLPDNLKLARHVGVGASTRLMKRNPRLTEIIRVDLNDVIEEQGINSEELRKLGTNTFDVIIMTNTMPYLTSPREVLRSAWSLLKPGGTMIIAFTNKEAFGSKFEKATTKMWRDYTDDQHMWIAGSFFQFSAGDGWENLKGFDISPNEARREEGLLASIKNRNKGMCMFVVQGSKGYQDESIDDSNPEKFFRSKMWMLPTLEERDKQLVAPRLTRAYQFASSQSVKDALANSTDALPKVYESLIKMDQFSFTFSMQAQLAANLVSDPDFNANDEQIKALKMGLGLRKPSEDFWQPIGEFTANMDPEDKINLLAYIIPRFGSGQSEQEDALKSFVSGLKPTFAVIRNKCPGMSEADVQLLGSELLAIEILKPGRSSKEEFASWLGALTEDEMKSYLERRKNFKKTAVEDMKAMQAEREEERRQIEEYRKKMEEQQEAARKERSMVFNPATGKMEAVKK